MKPLFILIIVAMLLTELPTSAAPESLADRDFRQAEFLFTHNRKDAAQKLLIELCKRPNATAPMYALLGDTYLVLGGVDNDAPGLREAEAGMLIGVQKDPGFGKLYRELAMFCNLQERYAESVVFATKAIQAERPDPLALRSRAAAYGHLGKRKEALADMRTYIKTNPPAYTDYMLEGDLEQSLQDFAGAEKSYRKAISYGQKGFKQRLFHSLIKSLEEQHKYAEAIEAATAEIKEDSMNTADAYEVRANMHVHLHESAAALSDLTAAISVMPTARYYKERAELYKSLGNNAAAELDLKKASESNNSSLF
jgi:tetratricopeptide (TPR) repeat protein